MVRVWQFDLVSYPDTLAGEALDPERVRQILDAHLDEWVRAEQHGFDGVFLGEHHFNPYRLTPSPNLMVAALAGRTSRLRIGIMANIVPMHSPWRLAEEGAMLDLLTGGRLDFGLARGADEHEFRKLDLSMEDTRPRLIEGTDFIVKAWTQPSFEHHGTYYRIGQASLVPRPLQRPHPPIWITATVSPQTLEWAARNRFGIASAFHPVPHMREIFERYHALAADAGHTTGPEQVAMTRHTYLAESEQQALEEGEAAFNFFVAQFRNVALFQDLDHLPASYELYKDFLAPIAAEQPPSFELLVQAGLVMAGTPAQVKEMIVEQCRATGAGNYLAWVWFGNLSAARAGRSIGLFAREVLPTLKSLGLAPAAT
jgi:alkanesulfonate monooxygenase SsuD/methylene tetrahydromethanopterin reductase-like flavin-dependent oxidoreductase (luciferase family)